MALSFAFRERLEHMEYTRNERLSLLQAEKELQSNKRQILASRLSDIQSMERKCLVLDQKNAFQSFKISAMKSEIERLDDKYLVVSQELRDLRTEIEELEETEKEKERFYEVKASEMKQFRVFVEKFVANSRNQVNEQRNRVGELKSTFEKLQGNDGFLGSIEIAAAEARTSKLAAIKQNLEKSVASNYQVRSQLERQLQNILIKQNQSAAMNTNWR